MTGRTISHYTVLEKLGAGGMGEIYKAQDTRLNRFVAIKALSTGNSGDPERRRRFIQEAQAASALNHPNIITIYDIVSQDLVEFMVMEFVAGMTLDDLIPKTGMTVQKTLDCAVQMADALQTAHAAGIVHRDLKPGNVMVTGTGLVKILDFGLAKLTAPSAVTQAGDETLPLGSGPMTVEGSILGTVCYMSPEQAQGKPVDARSDIFSFGLVVYEMLTGRKAFSADSSVSTLSAILRDEATPISQLVPSVPPELEQIVYRALRKEPEQRWQSMQEMRVALAALKQRSDSGTLFAVPAATQVPPSAKRSSKVAAWCAGGLLAAAAMGGWWWAHRTAPPAPTPTTAEVAPAPSPPIPAPVTPPAAPAETTLTNQSVLDMVQAKVPASVIVSQIRSSKTNFDLSTAEIIRLSQAGVSATILETMRNPKVVEPAVPRAAQPAAQLATPQPVQAPREPAPPERGAPKGPSVILYGGIPFEITLTEDVPVNVTPGQVLHFQVAKDFRMGGAVVIARGTPLTGQVVDAGEGRKLLIKRSRATFRLSQVEAVDGSKLSIRAAPGRRATDKADRPIEPPGHRSKDVLAPAGTSYLAFIDGDQTVTVRR